LKYSNSSRRRSSENRLIDTVQTKSNTIQYNIYFELIMRRSKSTKTGPKNDGLPIVNGRKISRRGRFGGLNNAIGVSRARGSHNSTFVPSFSLCAAVFVLMVFVVVQSGKEKEALELGLGLQEWASTEYTQLLTQWSTAITPDSADIVQLKGSASTSLKKTEVGTTAGATSATAGTIYSAMPDSIVYPEKCTAEQLALVLKQIPEDKWEKRTWRQVGMTLATAVSKSAYNPILMREFYASDQFKLNNLHTFFGIVMGWKNNDVPVDLLAIGSRDEKFNTNKWNVKLGLDPNMVLPPVEISSEAGIRPARVLVVEKTNAYSKASTLFKSLTDLYPLRQSNAELSMEAIEPRVLTSKKEFFDFITSKWLLSGGVRSDDQPIHYLDISGSDGDDVAILKTFVPFLKNVRYLHFEYSTHGSWTTPTEKKLSSVISDLRSIGMVCYFTGTKEADHDLWRITDCFLDHYEYHHWANIACVSAVHDDVKELVVRMENKFHETLKKDQKFQNS